MIDGSLSTFRLIRTLVSAGLLILCLVAATAAPALAQSGTWTKTGSMNGARLNHTATLLQNGQVLVASGSSGDAGAELYDPATGKFRPTGSMSTPRLRAHGDVATERPGAGCHRL
jgi:hypothetical protein